MGRGVERGWVIRSFWTFKRGGSCSFVPHIGVGQRIYTCNFCKLIMLQKPSFVVLSVNWQISWENRFHPTIIFLAEISETEFPHGLQLVYPWRTKTQTYTDEFLFVSPTKRHKRLFQVESDKVFKNATCFLNIYLRTAREVRWAINSFLTKRIKILSNRGLLANMWVYSHNEKSKICRKPRVEGRFVPQISRYEAKKHVPQHWSAITSRRNILLLEAPVSQIC